MNDLISSFVSDVCSILKIIPPKISFPLNDVLPASMYAITDSEGTEIIIKDKPLSIDLYCAIARELRYIWQLRSDLQIDEIDAIAFANVIMIQFFQIRSLPDDLPIEMRPQILARSREISSAYNL